MVRVHSVTNHLPQLLVNEGERVTLRPVSSLIPGQFLVAGIFTSFFILSLLNVNVINFPSPVS